jgi:AMP nucleosidase
MTNENTLLIVEEVIAAYDAAVKRLQSALSAYLKNRTLPDPRARANFDFAYPKLVISYGGVEKDSISNLAFGRLEKSGIYSSTITQPRLFARYLTRQLDLLCEQYEVEIAVTRSTQEIPSLMSWMAAQSWNWVQ